MVEVNQLVRIRKLEKEIFELKKNLKHGEVVRNSLFSLLLAELSNVVQRNTASNGVTVFNSGPKERTKDLISSVDLFVKQLIAQEYQHIESSLEQKIGSLSVDDVISRLTENRDDIAKLSSFVPAGDPGTADAFGVDLDGVASEAERKAAQNCANNELRELGLSVDEDTNAMIQCGARCCLTEDLDSPLSSEQKLSKIKYSWFESQLAAEERHGLKLNIKGYNSGEWFCFVCNQLVSDCQPGDHFCFSKVSKGFMCNYCGKCTSRMPDLRVHFRKIVYCKSLRKKLKRDLSLHYNEKSSAGGSAI